MKLFCTHQIPNIDRYTIDNEPIADIDLMERASMTISEHILHQTELKGKVNVFCGPGNNGGDGLAVARLLSEEKERFDVSVFILSFGKELKGSPAINLQRLQKTCKQIEFIENPGDLEKIAVANLSIDALFGSGLNRPLEGFPAELVQHINNSNSYVISVDVPSGLMGEKNPVDNQNAIVRARLTLTFQFPKLSFLFPENELFVGRWEVKDIGLHPDAIVEEPTEYYFTDDKVITGLMKDRSGFAHKGNFGHALLISGSYGKMGAAILASKACLRSGVGLLTTHVPHSGYQIIQTAVPEAMCSIDDSDIMFTEAKDLDLYTAIAAGPGMGMKVNSRRGLKKLLEEAKHPLVLDADALNILGENKEWIKLLPENSILTPHPKEFERLTEGTSSAFDRMEKARAFAKEHHLVLVVKGAHSMVVNPKGEVWFNSTGNPGMATAGSGDVLTGVILALLAQGYESFDAARIGVYVHGLAGDIAMARRGMEALIASDIIENLGEAFKLEHKKR